MSPITLVRTLSAVVGLVFLDLGYLVASVAWPTRRRRSAG